MTLPSFPGTVLDPIYLNLKQFEFNNTILNEQIVEVKSNKMYFNVNVIDDKIEPLETILQMIVSKSKMVVEVYSMDKNGNIMYKILLNNFMFISVNNLLDFKYNSNHDIMKLDVTYNFDNVEYINLKNKLLYRALKINKILKKDANGIIKLLKEELGM